MPSSPFPGTALLDRLGERANPVLVKEVRAALRGRAFVAGFVTVLALALAVGSIVMLVATSNSEEIPSGLGYLLAMSVVFALGAHGLVPFTAMASMSGEHDEGSLELLQLSGISPGRLVLGKLGASAVQAALLYAAFLPFLAFAFLLQGVDLVLLAAGIVASFAGSIAFSSIGILLGATLRVRWMRVLGYVGLAVALMVGVQGLFAWIAMGLYGGSSFTWSEYLLGLAITVLVASSCCVQATARLQHAEENRSTAFRVLGTSSLLVACGFGLASGSANEAFVWFLVGLGFALPSILIALAEPERLPRAVLARARRRGAPWYLAPWMPGGGRGVLLLLVTCALLLAAALLAVAFAPGRRLDWLRTTGALAAVEAWLVFAVLVPAGLAARWLDRPWVQKATRLACIAFPLLLLLLPAFLRFLAGSASDAFAHPGNPGRTARLVFEAREIADVLPIVLVSVAAVALSVGINAPRVLRSLNEVRRERERRSVPVVEGLGAQAQR